MTMERKRTNQNQIFDSKSNIQEVEHNFQNRIGANKRTKLLNDDSIAKIKPRTRNTVQNELIKNSLKGAEFNVIATNRSPEAIKALQDFNKHFYRGPIMQSDKKSNEGGEYVLTTLPPTDELPTSHHLMTFSGSQEWHYHLGQRDLNIFAADDFSLFAGGVIQDDKQKDNLSFVEVKFPAGSMVQLRFPGKFLHGFKGDDFCATSVHHTDFKEIEELQRERSTSVDTSSKDLMSELTSFVNKDTARLLASLDYTELEKSKEQKLRAA